MVLSGRSRVRKRAQHIAPSAADNTATSCVRGPLRAGLWKEDPELGVSGSLEEKGDIIALKATM
jgi:hypothetical protein